MVKISEGLAKGLIRLEASVPAFGHVLIHWTLCAHGSSGIYLENGEFSFK